MAESVIVAGALALHLGGASSGRHGRLSDVEFRNLVEEGANLFVEYSKDKKFCQHAIEWKTLMVTFQKKMMELLGTWTRIRQCSFFEEI